MDQFFLKKSLWISAIMELPQFGTDFQPFVLVIYLFIIDFDTKKRANKKLDDIKSYQKNITSLTFDWDRGQRQHSLFFYIFNEI